MKRTGRISFVAAFHGLLIAGAALAGPGASRTIDLRPHWKQGDAFYIEWESTSRNVWTQEGTFDCWVCDTHDRFGFIVRVEAVEPDGAARIELTFDRIASAYWWGGDREQGDGWDSDTDQPDAPSELRTVLQPVVGVTLTMEVGREGRITSFAGVDQLRQKVEQSDPAPDALDWFDDFLTVESQRARWEYWLTSYGFRPVERGDEWKCDITWPHHTTAIVSSLDRINSYDDRVLATVHLKGHGIPRADRKTKSIGDNVTWEFGECSFTERLTFDSHRGLIVSERGEAKGTSLRVERDPESGKETRCVVRSTQKEYGTTLTLEERRAQKRRSATAQP